MTQRYTMGEVPSEVITKAAREQCPGGFRMKIVDQGEWAALAEAWNQGIDAHLEALTERSTADPSTGNVLVHPDELATLVRRLWVIQQASDEFDESGAGQLCGAIVACLEIEEV